MHPRDANHWLYRLAPREWISSSLGELSRAQSALRDGDRRGGLAACRRAAGMALNGALAAPSEMDERFGRSYMDHLLFLRSAPTEMRVPDEVREAASVLLDTPLPAGGVELVALRTRKGDERLIEAARTVMAHALALVLRHEPASDATPDDAGDEGSPAAPCNAGTAKDGAKSDQGGEAQ